MYKSPLTYGESGRQATGVGELRRGTAGEIALFTRKSPEEESTSSSVYTPTQPKPTAAKPTSIFKTCTLL